MMRNRITFTISDVQGAWSFSLPSKSKKVAMYGFAVASMTFMSTIAALQYFSFQLQQLEDSHENLTRTIDGLNVKNIALAAEISSKADQLAGISEKLESVEVSLGLEARQVADVFERIAEINGKTEELAMVTDKLENIESRIGLKPKQDMDITKRVEYADLTAGQKLMLLQNVPSGWPLEDTLITGRYGMRKHPVTGSKMHHAGIDLRAKMNTPVYATADGVVEYAKYQSKTGYGRLLLIRHNYGFKTVYSHLNKFAVKYGDFVKKGDLIAYTGNSGRSNGPHLHYEVRYIHRALNPVNFVKWDMQNYEAIFDKEKEIQWLSLIQAVARQTYPLPPPSLHTALQ